MSWKIVMTQKDKEVARRETHLPSQAVIIMNKAQEHFTEIKQDTVIKMLDPQDKLVISVEVANLAPSQ
jgi:hypothetical protein